MFEKASRLKLRFKTAKGLCNTEDLWDLKLKGSGPNLDDIAVALHQELKDKNEISFVEPKEDGSEELRLKFNIVKHVIDVKLAEQKARAEARQVKEKKQRLLGIIADKEDQALKDMSLDDLKKML